MGSYVGSTLCLLGIYVLWLCPPMHAATRTHTFAVAPAAESRVPSAASTAELDDWPSSVACELRNPRPLMKERRAMRASSDPLAAVTAFVFICVYFSFFSDAYSSRAVLTLG